MPGRWLPCPGNRNATGGRLAVGRRGGSPGRYTAGAVPPVAGRAQLGPQVVDVVGHDRQPHRAPARRPPPRRRCRRSRQGRPAGRGLGQAGGQVVERPVATPASSPRKANSSAGHASTERSGTSPSGCDSTTAWKLVPPKPKALTPATRRSAVQGRASSRNTNGLVSGSQAWLGRVMCSVGGCTPW